MTWVRPVVCAVAVVLLGGCGLSTDDEPEAIPQPTVEPSASTPASTVVRPGEATENVTVFFLTTDDAGTSVEDVQRQVAQPATLGSRLDALLAQPPGEDERAQGIWSAIPASATLASPPQQRGHVLIVDMPSRIYDELHGLVAQDAFAQIVYTATAIQGVESVQFRRDGVTFEAVDGTGQASSRPLGREDFPEVALRPPDLPL